MNFTPVLDFIGGHAQFEELIPYAILALNSLLFLLLRILINKSINVLRNLAFRRNGKLLYIFTPKNLTIINQCINELVSTLEVCADCAELNIVYARHKTTAYATSLAILSFWWLQVFADAHTSPAYMFEEFFCQSKQATNDDEEDKKREGASSNQEALPTYARFVGQAMAIPLAVRFASIYWQYNLVKEHVIATNEFVSSKCQTALTTSMLNGFLIELSCCFLARSVELICCELLDARKLNHWLISSINACFGTLLVVLALEHSGGYFNPVLAASLEFACAGMDRSQHFVVYWLGPLLGHLVARKLFAVLRTRFASSRQSSAAQFEGESKASAKTTASQSRTSNKTQAHVVRRKSVESANKVTKKNKCFIPWSSPRKRNKTRTD